jgi:hypothetical protein
MTATASFINTMLDTAFTGTKTMKLFRAGLPSTTGVEVSGGGYAAQTVTMAAAAAKEKATSTDVVFSDLPTSQTIVAYGIYIGGVLKDEALLATPFTPSVTNNELNISYKFSLAGV